MFASATNKYEPAISVQQDRATASFLLHQRLGPEKDTPRSRRPAVRVLAFVLVGLIVAGCATGSDPTAASSLTVSTPAAAATVTAPIATPEGADPAALGAAPEAATVEIAIEATDPSTTKTETTEMAPNDEQERCQRLTDFESDRLNQQWLVVNDNVMGGQSLGALAFEAGVLVFEGEINTDGGGFASLRLPLEPGALVDHDRIEFRARPDDRPYMVTFDDNLSTRDRRVSHRAPIEFGTPGEWQTVSVSFDDLFPAVFERPIDDLAFRKDLATRMGLMISDSVDGAFRLEVDWIDLCSG